MKAAQLVGPKQFGLTDVPMPTARDGECLIKLEALSVCGSDIRHEYGRLFPRSTTQSVLECHVTSVPGWWWKAVAMSSTKASV